MFSVECGTVGGCERHARWCIAEEVHDRDLTILVELSVLLTLGSSFVAVDPMPYLAL